MRCFKVTILDRCYGLRILISKVLPSGNDQADREAAGKQALNYGGANAVRVMDVSLEAAGA